MRVWSGFLIQFMIPDQSLSKVSFAHSGLGSVVNNHDKCLDCEPAGEQTNQATCIK